MTALIADVLIPLALDTAYSYAVPDHLALADRFGLRNDPVVRQRLPVRQ